MCLEGAGLINASRVPAVMSLGADQSAGSPESGR